MNKHVIYKLQAVASDSPSLPARNVKASDRQRHPLRTVASDASLPRDKGKKLLELE